jgi:hypothetical protein
MFPSFLLQISNDKPSTYILLGKLRQWYDDLKERYIVSDITVSVQSRAYHPFAPFFF